MSLSEELLVATNDLVSGWMARRLAFGCRLLGGLVSGLVVVARHAVVTLIIPLLEPVLNHRHLFGFDLGHIFVYQFFVWDSKVLVRDAILILAWQFASLGVLPLELIIAHDWRHISTHAIILLALAETDVLLIFIFSTRFVFFFKRHLSVLV